MLYLDLERIMTLRGISSPQKFLMENGFSSNIAHRIMHQFDSYIKFQYLEKLCLLLHCTPNDLLNWNPPAGQGTVNDQPLSALIHNTAGILDSFKKAPIEKLQQFQQWMAQQDVEGKQ